MPQNKVFNSTSATSTANSDFNKNNMMVGLYKNLFHFNFKVNTFKSINYGADLLTALEDRYTDITLNCMLSKGRK